MLLCPHPINTACLLKGYVCIFPGTDTSFISSSPCHLSILSIFCSFVLLVKHTQYSFLFWVNRTEKVLHRYHREGLMQRLFWLFLCMRATAYWDCSFILVSPSKAGLCNDFSLISVTYSGLLCSSAIVDHYVWCAKSQCTCCAPVLPSQWKNPKIVPKSLFLHLIAVSPAVSNARARTSWSFVQCNFHIDPSQ